jgi:peptidoglycan L-alanyl-D-glutamate endopeptidase CwlK
MINSRSLDDLLPLVRQRVEAFIKAAQASGIDLLVTSTYRDNESQNALYSQGRTTAGKIVTNAKAGQSFHNYRCAVDVVPIINGKPVWDTSYQVWQTIGRLGKEAGLEWAGDWVKFKEYPHFQYTSGFTLAELKQQKISDESIV